ncbi:MKI67 FHA domain-interacting nucleolar phosphoprotein-like [Plodia interpunctella]|uniref:MKI67 FHA domain-interacting nucleolar phosphoprotein-like n=1 Tax=Plodia interpunctella TaxID=58824 RepID=UPI002368E3CE|nr:MKI67 FHA domain-interacting nucleolar phosphoprotein-like [Plodia interpunctella]
MEENVALDSSKQKQFVKSIKGIKKKLNKKIPEISTSNNVAASKIKEGKSKKRKIKERGLVYLAHVPHGFYENEMTQYFKQFGMVTNVRVIRSKRTGNSKGYAFVEFKEPTVAQIVAETMNNYLMGKRLLKAAYIPPEKQRPYAMRKKWNPTHNPGRDAMIKQKKAYNADKNDSQDLKIARKTLSNINKTKEKLRALGIDYDFFTPVDVPEELLSSDTAKNREKQEKSKKPKTIEIVQPNKVKQGKIEMKNDKKTKGKKIEQVSNINSKQQKQKEQKLKEKGVKPAENFIKVLEESGDESDSSLEFDSDEFEKLMENEDDSLGSEDKDSSEDGSDNSDEESEELPKIPLVINPNKLKNQGNKKPQMKRKPVLVMANPPKKSKFEKQQKNPQFAKKQLKKKK